MNAKITDASSFSVSIFVLEADRKPILAVAAKTHAQAEQFCTDERVRTVLREASLSDDYSILRVRMSRPAERARYHEQRDLGSAIGWLHAAYMIDPAVAEN
jgi:hypothetical protein